MPSLGLGLGLQRAARSGISGGGFPSIVISGDAYAGGTITVTGGQKSRVNVGPDPTVYGPGNRWMTYAYQLVIDGISVGPWFFDGSTTLPLDLNEGQEIQVQDNEGNISDAVSALDPLYGMPVISRTMAVDDFFQDTGATNPAIADGDPVNAWEGEFQTFIRSFGVAATLRITSGKRWAEFAGNTVLQATVERPFPFWIAVASRHTGGSLTGSVGYSNGNVAVGAHNATFAPPNNAFWGWTPNGGGTTYGQAGDFNTNWNTHILECPSDDETTWRMWLNGVLTGSPGLTSGVPVDTATTCMIGNDGNDGLMIGGISSQVQGSGTLTDSDVLRLNHFLTRLRPS